MCECNIFVYLSVGNEINMNMNMNSDLSVYDSGSLTSDKEHSWKRLLSKANRGMTRDLSENKRVRFKIKGTHIRVGKGHFFEGEWALLTQEKLSFGNQ